METTKSNSETFDENESLQIIKEMIQVSQNKLKNDGILLIIWGWIFFITYFFLNYLTSVYKISDQIVLFVRILRIVLPLSGLTYSIYYIFKQRKRLKTYIGNTLVYVWTSLFISMVLINVIQFNVLGKIYFELQHPIYMVLTAFAIVVTGGILRYRLIIFGGIIFGILALISSYFSLQDQLLIESLAWIIAFIIPGHFLYSKRNK